MPRYIRVRATKPQGCWRAGIFHGVKPVTYDQHELTPDQVNLLRAENNRLLLVDEFDDPATASVVPDGDKIGSAEQFESHPQVEVEKAARKEAEQAKLDAEAKAAELQKQLDEAEQVKGEASALHSEIDDLHARMVPLQAERDDLRKALEAAQAENAELKAAAAKPQEGDRAQAILDAVRQVVASGEGLTAAGVPKVDALEAVLGFDITAAERDQAWAAHNEA